MSVLTWFRDLKACTPATRRGLENLREKYSLFDMHRYVQLIHDSGDKLPSDEGTYIYYNAQTYEDVDKLERVKFIKIKTIRDLDLMDNETREDLTRLYIYKYIQHYMEIPYGIEAIEAISRFLQMAFKGPVYNVSLGDGIECLMPQLFFDSLMDYTASTLPYKSLSDEIQSELASEQKKVL